MGGGEVGRGLGGLAGRVGGGGGGGHIMLSESRGHKLERQNPLADSKRRRRKKKKEKKKRSDQ